VIEYLRIEIRPTCFAGNDVKELNIKISDSRAGEFGSTRIIEPDELVSFFDQIWECAGKTLLYYLKESRDKTSSLVSLQAPESPVEA